MPPTTLGVGEERPATIDFTPTFTIKSEATADDAFPEVPLTWPEVTLRRSPSWDVDATAMVSRPQLAEYLHRLFGEMTQTATATGSQIWVVPLSVRPSDLIGDFRQRVPAVSLAPPSPAEVALEAVASLQKWLAIGQDQVALLAQYAPRSLKNWRGGMAPYPATVRRLFDLHALLGSLTRAMGVESARLWLSETSRDGMSRRDRLGDDAGLRQVISEASEILFERPTVPPVHALDFDEEPERKVARRPDLFAGPVRRARRRP